jgi:hypothetical protein
MGYKRREGTFGVVIAQQIGSWRVSFWNRVRCGLEGKLVREHHPQNRQTRKICKMTLLPEASFRIRTASQ